MHLIDTHAHIYLPEFDNDREGLMERAKEAGVEKILMPAVDSGTHPAMLEAEEKFEPCIAMMGLHPCSVTAQYKEELAVVVHWLEQRKFIAIGEIGLDFYWDKTFTKEQYEAFHQQIELALQYDVPIVIHSRNAVDECIEVVQQYPRCRGIFHCFSGSEQQAQRIIEAGFLMGIGGVVTFKNAGLDKVLQQTGLDHVVLETDAPYLAPVPYRGKRNESSYLPYVAQKLSSITGHDPVDIAAITTANTQKIFSL